MDAGTAPATLTLYDRMCWPEEQLEQALATGAHARELRAWFGGSEYTLLAALARRAACTPVRHPTQVYLLPGILGSQLGRRRANAPPDLLWPDPADIHAGRLLELGWQLGADLVPLGGVPFSYLRLKLRLRTAGYAVTIHDYDWRHDLTAAAAGLAQRLAADPAHDLALIGHSMGGLLARATLRLAGAERVRHVVLLGAPHHGSIAAAQALRATYPVVCRLAALDPNHSAAELTAAVFRHFPSLYQLLPQPGVHGGIDIFDPAQWPRTGPGPDTALLAAARAFGQELAPADARHSAIIGTGQRTATALRHWRGQFAYEITAGGDGTVAAASARLAGSRNYYLRCEHSELPRHPQVAAAVIELLRRGHTHRLATQWRARTQQGICVSDAALRGSLAGKIDWNALGMQARRQYFDRLNQPPPAYRAAPRTRSRRSGTT